MRRVFILLIIASVMAVLPAVAQSADPDALPNLKNQAPPRSDDQGVVSSSKDTRIDLSPPSGDLKMHPNSGVADDVLEMHPYDPHKAEKDIEVGDFYFSQKNFRAAESRYQEALQYKPNDADATYKLAVSQEKLGEMEDALAAYQSYLKILPDGPKASDAKEAIQRITDPAAQKESKETGKEKKQKKK